MEERGPGSCAEYGSDVVHPSSTVNDADRRGWGEKRRVHADIIPDGGSASRRLAMDGGAGEALLPLVEYLQWRSQASPRMVVAQNSTAWQSLKIQCGSQIRPIGLICGGNYDRIGISGWRWRRLWGHASIDRQRLV